MGKESTVLDVLGGNESVKVEHEIKLSNSLIVAVVIIAVVLFFHAIIKRGN